MLARPVAAAALAVGIVAGAFEAPTAATSVRPTAFKFDDYTLPNGLRVILLEDHSTPIVHVTLWYHVGSKDEKTGRTGFAHLFEHMMFKGSKNVQPEAHTSYIASVGGQSNAYTTEDTTVFWQTVPEQYLPLTLWLEADRMASLRIEDADVQDRAAGGQGGTPAAGGEPAVRPPLRDHLRPARSRRTPTSTPSSAAWPTSRPRASRTCASSTAPTTVRTTRRW